MNQDKPISLLTTTEVLTIRKVSLAKLKREVAAGTFPAPIRDGRRNLFIREEVEAWLAALAASRPRVSTQARPALEAA